MTMLMEEDHIDQTRMLDVAVMFLELKEVEKGMQAVDATQMMTTVLLRLTMVWGEEEGEQNRLPEEAEERQKQQPEGAVRCSTMQMTTKWASEAVEARQLEATVEAVMTMTTTMTMMVVRVAEPSLLLKHQRRQVQEVQMDEAPY